MDNSKPQNPTDPSANKDSDKDIPHENVNLSNLGKFQGLNKLRILHVEDIPIECNYDSIATALGIYGLIKEIRMCLNETDQTWESWITYEKHEAAFNACRDISKVLICSNQVKGSLTDKFPRNLDCYKPTEWTCETPKNPILIRTPKSPMWLVATAREDKYNYYKLSKHLQKMVGGIKTGNITRFGKGKILIHAKSTTQSLMLIHTNLQNDPMLKDIKPHYNFSYGRGVIFDRDLYEFEENEILEMSQLSIFKIKKIPHTNMIILTFEDENVPSHVIFENERVKVRPFHPRPLQCYNCFEYGHPSNMCKNTKICSNCSNPEHGTCQLTSKCSNCSLDHKSTDKNCPEYKYEEAAIYKANAEHITIGYAKRLLGRPPSYAGAVKSSSINTTGAQHSTPITGGGVAVPVVKTRSTESNITPVSTRIDPIPTERESPLEIIAPAPHLSSEIQWASQVVSLPDLMDQEQSSVTKRGRTPSSSPPHVRQKCNSPQRITENKPITKKINAEIHSSLTHQKREEINKAKYKPQISRKTNGRSKK